MNNDDKPLSIIRSKLNYFIATDDLIDVEIRLALSELPPESFQKLIKLPQMYEFLVNGDRLQIIKALLSEIRINKPGFLHKLV